MRCSSNFIHTNSHACPPRGEKWRRQKRNKKEETGAFAQLLMGLLNLNNSALKKILRLWVWTRTHTHTHTVLRMNLLCSAATANVLPRWTRIDSCYAFHVKNLLFLFLLHQFHIISQQCKNQWPVCTNECGHLLPVYHSSIRASTQIFTAPFKFLFWYYHIPLRCDGWRPGGIVQLLWIGPAALPRKAVANMQGNLII